MKWIEGYEGHYAIDKCGKVLSFKKSKTHPKELKAHVASHGYLVVALCKDGIPSNRYVHHLVAEAFIGKREHGMQVRHLDGSRSNPSLFNLAYGTASDNEQDKKHHGTYHIGSNHPSSKLDEKSVLEIKKMLSSGEKSVFIAKRFNVSQQSICDIKKGRVWSHVNAG